MGQECVLVSERVVPACSSYSDLETCRECESGYFLTPSGECLAVVVQPFCESYSRESRVSECIACSSSFYLSPNGSCVRRLYSRSISECQVHSTTSDTCQKCKDGFHLSSDQLKCLVEIAQCAEYFSSNRQSTESTCARCKPNFHFDIDGNCVSGDQSNCDVYKKASNICEICQNGYFLEGQSGKCVKHEDNAACAAFDPQIRDKCLQHGADHQELAYLNMCVPLPVISNCAEYSRSELNAIFRDLKISELPSSEFWTQKQSQIKCQQCKEGFQPSLDASTCVPISVDPNCSVVFDSQCVECDSPKTVSGTGTCIEPHPLEASFCARADSSTHSPNCLECKPESISISANSTSLCLDESNLNFLTGETLNCSSYKVLDDGAKQCHSCRAGFSLDSDSKSCFEDDLCDAVIKHPLEVSPIVPNAQGSGYNGTNLFSRTDSMCVKPADRPSSPANCHIFVPGLKGELGCVRCKSDHVALLDMSRTGNTSKNYVKFDQNGDFLSKVSFRQEIAECVPATSVNTVLNCARYFRIDQSSIGCLSCAFGFIGKVNQNQSSISECIEQQANGCEADRRLEGLDWDASARDWLAFAWGTRSHPFNLRFAVFVSQVCLRQPNPVFEHKFRFQAISSVLWGPEFKRILFAGCPELNRMSRAIHRITESIAGHGSVVLSVQLRPGLAQR